MVEIPEGMKETAAAAGASHRVRERQWLLRTAALIYRRRHVGRSQGEKSILHENELSA